MKIQIDVNPSLIDDVMACFPEAGMCLRCIAFDYRDCRFAFWDYGADADSPEPSQVAPTIESLDTTHGRVSRAVVYRIDRTDLERGMSTLLVLLRDGRLRGLGLSIETINDAGNWDVWCADALAQCSIFGDVIYG